MLSRYTLLLVIYLLYTREGGGEAAHIESNFVSRAYGKPSLSCATICADSPKGVAVRAQGETSRRGGRGCTANGDGGVEVQQEHPGLASAARLLR